MALEVFCTPTLFGGPNPLFVFEVAGWAKIILIAMASLLAWVPVALFGPPTDDAVLRRFAGQVRPPGRAWRPYFEGTRTPLAGSFFRFLAGLYIVFGTLFGIGELLLGSPLQGTLAITLAALTLGFVIRSRPQPMEPAGSNSP